MKDNILVIEKSRVLRTRIASGLTKVGFRVTTAPDYLEGLLVLNEFKPDLAIVDGKLPLVNGWEACYQLHRAFDIPVILMGSDSRGQAWARAAEAGADFYLIKPFSYPELLSRVKATFRRYQKATAGRCSE